jgi:hypothetical protein
VRQKLAEGQARVRVEWLEDLCARLVAELAIKNAHIENLQYRLRCAREIRWLALRTKRRQEDIMALVERLAVLTPAQVTDLLDEVKS